MNITKTANITSHNRISDPIMGKGTALWHGTVAEPGYGFPEPGIYAIVDWDNCPHKTGFDEDGYAISPIYLGVQPGGVGK